MALHQEWHIAVWWRNDATGRLMLLLAYFMTRHADWEDGANRIRPPRDLPLDDILAFCPTTIMVSASRDVDLDAAQAGRKAPECET